MASQTDADNRNSRRASVHHESRIADQHGDEVDHLKDAEPFACEEYLVAESRQHSQMGEVMDDDGDFTAPSAAPQESALEQPGW